MIESENKPITGKSLLQTGKRQEDGMKVASFTISFEIKI